METYFDQKAIQKNIVQFEEETDKWKINEKNAEKTVSGQQK